MAAQGTANDIFYGYLGTAAYSAITTQQLFSAANLVITSKLHNTQGSQVEFIFTIKSKQIVVSTSTYIYMNFPTSYSPYLTNNYVYCLMNSIFVDCSVAMPYTLLITNLPVTLALGTSFVIRVFGIQ